MSDISQNVAERLARHLDQPPRVDPTAFVHPRAVVMGDVELGPRSSVWPGAVLRGDINSIRVGAESNIQDGAVVHLADRFGVVIGERVTVGHLAMVHACTIGDECLIGMHSTVLDGAEIGPRSIIGAGALVPPGMRVPPGSLVVGVPGKVVRTLSDEEQADLKNWALKYVEVAAGHRARLKLAAKVPGGEAVR